MKDLVKVMPAPDVRKLTARTVEGRLEIRAIVEEAIAKGWLTPGVEQAFARPPERKGAWVWGGGAK